MPPRHRRHLAMWALACAAACSPARAQQGLEVTQLSLEDLMNLELTTVSRKAQRLSDSAAAATVVTADDIRRSGATSLPEALRMVPGLEVARIGPSRWAVTARGFNSRFANKLLVLIDGRSVYSPLFSGVFWEAEDVLLEDVDRIEVIRGPGAALWGANAVNGIINIVTRVARRTQGTLVSALAGDEDRGQLGLRHGLRPDPDTALRLWTKLGHHAPGLDSSGARAGHDWDYLRGGFRLDRELGGGARLGLHGTLGSSRSGESVLQPSLQAPYAVPVAEAQINRGGHLAGQLDWTMPNGDPASLQATIDHSVVDFQGEIRNVQTTLDLDFQRRSSLGHQHDLVWGLGLRSTLDETDSSGVLLSLSPRRTRHHLISAFVHDELTLVPDTWRLIAGTKLEHNSYTGLEWQPNLRALWTPDPQQTAWAALSRAVRTPSRAERDAAVNLQVSGPGTADNPGPLPVLTHVQPNRDLGSEAVVTAELGWRRQLGSRLSLDLAAFHSRYRDLRSASSLSATPDFSGTVPYVRYETTTTNTQRARVSGLELSADWRVTPQWRLRGFWSRLSLHASRNGDPANDAAAQLAEGNSPRQQQGLVSSLDLPHRQELDLRLKHVAARPAVGIAAYTELDLRWAWRATPTLELSVVGQNLLGAHAESGSDPLPSQLLQVPRGGYLKARWQF